MMVVAVIAHGLCRLYQRQFDEQLLVAAVAIVQATVAAELHHLVEGLLPALLGLLAIALHRRPRHLQQPDGGIVGGHEQIARMRAQSVDEITSVKAARGYIAKVYQHLGNLSRDEAVEYGEVREVNVAYFVNHETVDIPVVKEWVGGPAVEDVNLHLERHLFDLSEVSDSEITDEYVKSKENQENFWETVGYTHYAKRGDFVNSNGTPMYDEGSTTTSSKKYEDISGFNLNLPKYEVVGNKTYRIVYRLLEDNTSDCYTRSYKSIQSDG